MKSLTFPDANIICDHEMDVAEQSDEYRVINILTFGDSNLPTLNFESTMGTAILKIDEFGGAVVGSAITLKLGARVAISNVNAAKRLRVAYVIRRAVINGAYIQYPGGQ